MIPTNWLTLKLEVSPGRCIDNAADDLCHAAERFGVVVESAFNGITLFVKPGDTPGKVLDSYRNGLKRESEGKIHG